jgi:hypothetical protein
MKQNKFAPLIASLLFFLLLLPQLSSQSCTLVCSNGSPSSPGQIAPGSNCIAVVKADSVLLASTGCMGSYQVTARTLLGATIATGINQVSIPATPYLNTVIEIRVTNIAAGNSCSSFYEVVDNQSPAISCPSDTVPCHASLLPSNITPVVYSDNCDQNVTLNHFDSEVISCGFSPSLFIGRIDRTWIAIDDSGNSSSCTQQIFLKRTVVSAVTIPGPVTLECGTDPSNADPEFTGYPSWEGIDFESVGKCTLSVDYDDTVLTGCGGTQTIMREWTVRSLCNPLDVKVDTQLIYFTDTTPPQISCEDTLVVSTGSGVCNAAVTVPDPVISDNCSINSWSVVYYNGMTMPSTNFSSVAAGIYDVLYEVSDDCSNFSSCTTKLLVQDTETPVAVCDEIKIVSIPSNGQATLAAIQFDDGSHDNCTPLVFSVNRDGGTFGPTVSFNCNDVGDSVMVTLRVTEVSNPSSFNDCMNIVVVQDKLFPAISCPLNQTVSCTADLSNLAVFGNPVVTENCSFSIVSSSTQNIQNCGTGTITRTFTATDISGQSATCTQTINVVNNSPFNGSGIVWPANYTAVNACAPPSSFAPGMLPTGFDVPSLPPTSCAMLATNYSDQLYFVSYPACYKIIRTWKVLDWCQFNPANPTVGVWTYQQVIAIMDTAAPEITSCPPPVTASLGPNCSPAMVALPPVVATDCSPNLSYQNDSPYNGANASGSYPEGVHTIKFTVKDGCGNKSTCTTTVTVIDLQKPTPFCNSGVVAELQEMGGQVMATVLPVHLNHLSFDNCTASGNLIFNLRMVGDTSAPTASSLVFNCLQVDTFLVELWVTDEEGNSDYCSTDVIIQDNMDLCPSMDTLTVMVAGVISTVPGDMIPGVQVAALNTGMAAGTGITGQFQLGGLQAGSSYTISPQKNDDLLNGVTTFDLVLLSRHVLGLELLNTPYKVIAADINKSGTVTTLDIVELRKVILFLSNSFPNNNSWRFVRKNYVFPNPVNPFSPAFPETVNFSNMVQNVTNANFTGVKIGDLNGSADLNFGGEGSTGERNANGEVVLLLEDAAVRAGDELVVPLRLTRQQALAAMQFTLEYNKDDLEFSSMEEGSSLGVEDPFSGYFSPEEGVVTVSWYRNQPAEFEREDALFNLFFKAKKTGRLSDMVSVSSSYTQALAYDARGEVMRVAAEFQLGNAREDGEFRLYQNQPNPFSASTQIRFVLPEADKARLSIMDLSGQVIRVYEDAFEKGLNEVTIDRSDLPASGVLFYRLEASGFSATRKMILL